MLCSSLYVSFVFFFKQKTAYEMRISDWSSDVCSSDLPVRGTWRIAARDSELGGVPIPKGKMVFLNFGAANRDANQFPDPEELDVERKNAITSLKIGRAHV